MCNESIAKFIKVTNHSPAKACHCPSPEWKIVRVCDGVRQNWPSSSEVVFSHCDFITPTAIIVMEQM